MITTPRLALITGSTSGIGLGIARALSEAGYRIVLNGVGSAESIQSAVTSVQSSSPFPVEFLGTDLTQPHAIETALGALIETLGPVSVLVNNAGAQHVAPISEFPVEAWDRLLALNLSAAFHTIRLALPGMIAQRFGRVINIASVHGLVASKDKSAYVASKHGLVGLTKAVALETAQLPITCNAICPGWTETPLIADQIRARADALGIEVTEGGRQLLMEKQPSLEFVTPEQLGALVCFLCTDAAKQLTGATIPVDGGWTAQ